MGTVIGLRESYIANDCGAPAGCRFLNPSFDALVEPGRAVDRRNGTGKRLFRSGTLPAAFSPTGTRTTGTGVVITTYRRAGKPTYGTAGSETT
jgi:hypothetical protein